RGGRGAAATAPQADGTPAPGGRTFIDKVNIKTGEHTRIFETDNTGQLNESVSTVLDPEMKRLVLTRHDAQTPPQQFLYDNGNRKQITNNEDLFSELSAMQIQRVNVSRADGFTFRTVVYLPKDYKQGTRLAAFFWFYPYEYTSQENFDNAT